LTWNSVLGGIYVTQGGCYCVIRVI